MDPTVCKTGTTDNARDCIFLELKKEKEIDRDKVTNSIDEYSRSSTIIEYLSTYEKILELLVVKVHKAIEKIEDCTVKLEDWNHPMPVVNAVIKKMQDWDPLPDLKYQAVLDKVHHLQAKLIAADSTMRDIISKITMHTQEMYQVHNKMESIHGSIHSVSPKLAKETIRSVFDDLEKQITDSIEASRQQQRRMANLRNELTLPQ
jgi:DNA repair ATPase RecN